jgi:hypothetical protein
VLEDAIAFAGVSKYPARIKCALLGWMAWKDATARALVGLEAATDTSTSVAPTTDSSISATSDRETAPSTTRGDSA